MDSPATSRWVGRRYLVNVQGVRIPSYTAMLYLGCVAGISVGALVAGDEGLDELRFASAAVAVLVAALMGARLGFVLRHWGVFRSEPQRIWRRREGGAVLYGGLVLGMAAALPVLAVVGLPFWRFWDAASVTMLVGLIIGRFGCLMHGCCAGKGTDSPLGVWLPNHRGEWQRRFPTPLLESGWAAVVLVGALFARPHLPFAGALFAAVAASYAGGRFLLELTRESVHPPGSLPANLIASAALVVGGAAALIMGWPK